jgi:endosialidase-like protein
MEVPIMKKLLSLLLATALFAPVLLYGQSEPGGTTTQLSNLPQSASPGVLAYPGGSASPPGSYAAIPSGITLDVSQLTQGSLTDTLPLALLPPPTVSYPGGNITLSSSNNATKLVYTGSGSSTVTVAPVTGAITPGYWVIVDNDGTGVVTIAYGSSTLNGAAANLYLSQGMTTLLWADGTGSPGNYVVATAGGFSVASSGNPIFYDALEVPGIILISTSCGASGSRISEDLTNGQGIGFCSGGSKVINIDGSGNMNFLASGYLNFLQNTGTIVVPTGGGLYNNGSAGTIDIATNSKSAIHIDASQNVSMVGLGYLSFPQNTGTVVVPTNAGIYNNGVAGSIDIGTNGTSAIHIDSSQHVYLSSVSDYQLLAQTNAGTIGGIAYGALNTTLRGQGTMSPPAFSANTTPNTTAVGDMWYGSASNVMSALAGSTSATPAYLTQTGTGSASAAPSWTTQLNLNQLNVPGGLTASGISTTGIGLSIGTQSFTDTNPNTSLEAIYSIKQPTLNYNGSSGVTTSALATLYVGAPTSGYTGSGGSYTTTNKYAVYVAGSIAVTTAAVLSGLTTATGSDYVCISSTGQLEQDTTCTTSSARYKELIQSFFGGLWETMKMRPITFFYKKEALGKNPNQAHQQLGFTAEEMQKVESRLVVYNAAGAPESIDYPKITAVLVSAVQWQQYEIYVLAAWCLFLTVWLARRSGK